jgi:hypothetical protein
MSLPLMATPVICGAKHHLPTPSETPTSIEAW